MSCYHGVMRYQCKVQNCPETSSEVIEKTIAELKILRQNIDLKFCRSIAILSSHQNDFNAISKFQKKNPDLLRSHIFSLACASGRDYKTLLSISHTCSLWHTLCAETSSLYQCINVTSTPKQLLEHLYMKRAQHSKIPYSLTFHLSYRYSSRYRRRLSYRNPDKLYNQKGAFSFCVQHCSQIRELVFTDLEPQQWTSSLLAEHAFPKLEVLTLTAPSGELLEEVQGHILPTLFKEYPKLRELSMTGFRMPFARGMYVGLCKVYIETSGEESREDVGILQLFEDSQNLEEFTFLSQQPQPFHKDDAVPSVGHLINLPHLRTLNLKLSSYEISYLLSSISTPSTLCLTVESVLESHRIKNGPTSLLPSDPRCLPCIGRIQTLQVDMEDRTIKGYAEPDGEDFKHSPIVQLSSLESNGSLWQACADSVVMTLRSMRALEMVPSLRSLELRDHYVTDNSKPLSAEDVTPLFRLGAEISKFTLACCDPSIIPQLSAHFSHSIAPYGRALDSLSFVFMPIRASMILPLCESLASRGRPITLGLEYCDFDSEHAKTQLLEAIRALGIKLELEVN